MLDGLLVADVYLFMMIFARLGSAIVLLPGFGEVTVPARVRLIIALTVSFVVFPIVSPAVPPTPPILAELFLLLGGEILIGLAMGAIARLLLSMLQVRVRFWWSRMRTPCDCFPPGRCARRATRFSRRAPARPRWS